jgi:hypothetical protein
MMKEGKCADVSRCHELEIRSVASSMRGGAFNFVDVRIWEQRKSSNAPGANFDENEALRDARVKRGLVLQISSQVTKPLWWCGLGKTKSNPG